MLCVLCNQEPATIHLTLCQQGEPPFSADLCVPCAKKFDCIDDPPGFDLADIEAQLDPAQMRAQYQKQQERQKAGLPPSPVNWQALKEAVAKAKAERGED